MFCVRLRSASEFFTLLTTITTLSQAIGNTLTFDDVNLPVMGLIEPPTPYHHLSFASFSVFAPRSATFEGIIASTDLNCAVSSPNALLGSRVSENGPAASFEVSNATAMLEAGLEPSFALQSLMVKPMATLEPGTNLTIRGHREGNQVIQWSVWFPYGYFDSFQVRIEEFSKIKWDALQKVEIMADFGEDRLDWEFCVDDLVVNFTRSQEQPGQIGGYAHFKGGELDL